MLNPFSSKTITKFSALLLLSASVALLSGCGGGGGPGVGAASAVPTTTTASGVPAVATIQLSGSPTTVKSDGSTTSTITVTAVSANNATIAGAVVTLTADTGLLSAQSVTTGATGQATLTFSSGTANRANRTATITATSGTSTALLPVQIVGSTVTLASTGTSLPANGTSPATVTLTAKDAGGTPISGVPVILTQSGGGGVVITPSTGVTNSAGTLAVAVAGTTAGTVTVSATGAGATATGNFTVAAATSTFGINQLTLTSGGVTGTPVVPVSPKNSAMKIGDSLVVQVNAPAPTTQVAFATSVGTWNGAASSVVTVTPVAGVASAVLNTAVAGVANVQVVDPTNSALSDTLTVGMTASTPASIKLQASRTSISKSVGTSVGFSNLTATVYDASGAPVGGAPVAFSIVSGGTSSGETLSPVLVYTAATTANGLPLGAAPTTFTSGSLASGGAGIEIRASVVGTPIATNPISGVVSSPTSSADVAVIVGGTAGSVAFGQATKIIDAGSTSTIYSMPMSVLVADSNGSPAPLGTVVTISTWPIAFSTGSACVTDPDNGTNKGTFYNEDVNQNLILDPGEDGTRKYFATGTLATGVGTKDGKITPQNSYGGTVVSTNPLDAPGTATTDATGLASFNLTYTKSSANWIISRIHAQAMIQGTPAVGQLDFRLLASQADSAPCVLPPSPFVF